MSDKPTIRMIYLFVKPNGFCAACVMRGDIPKSYTPTPASRTRLGHVVEGDIQLYFRPWVSENGTVGWSAHPRIQAQVVYELPDTIQEALNSGDRSYRP